MPQMNWQNKKMCKVNYGACCAVSRTRFRSQRWAGWLSNRRCHTMPIAMVGDASGNGHTDKP